MLLQVGSVILTSEILTECFCCDLAACKGACCVDGDSGAPLSPEETGELENALDAVWENLSASAQTVIDRQGVVCTDVEGDLVTSIVNGKDCVFTCYGADGCCYCTIEKACRAQRISWQKPISCALYPIREKKFKNGMTGLQYHRWDICRPAVERGRMLKLKIYQFLRAPLIRRFGEPWYAELCQAAKDMEKEGGTFYSDK